MQYAFEGSQLAGEASSGPSIFTSALVEGIRTGDADRNQDGYISLDELYDYVYDRVRDRTPHQTPSKWEFGLRGDLYIARNPHRRNTYSAVPPTKPGSFDPTDRARVRDLLSRRSRALLVVVVAVVIVLVIGLVVVLRSLVSPGGAAPRLAGSIPVAGNPSSLRWRRMDATYT